MMHLSSNDTRESMFGHRNFPPHQLGSNLGPLAAEASALPMSYHAIMMSFLNICEEGMHQRHGPIQQEQWIACCSMIMPWFTRSATSKGRTRLGQNPFSQFKASHPGYRWGALHQQDEVARSHREQHRLDQPITCEQDEIESLWESSPDYRPIYIFSKPHSFSIS